MRRREKRTMSGSLITVFKEGRNTRERSVHLQKQNPYSTPLCHLQNVISNVNKSNIKKNEHSCRVKHFLAQKS